MKITLGPIELEWGSTKTYEQLRQIISREQSGPTNLKVAPKQQIEAYRSWVYDCVTLISDRIGSLPYAFYNKNTGEKLSTKNKNFAVYTKPFRQPNEFMSFRFIKQFCQIQLDLCGMSVIYPLRNVLGQVWELWPLNMNDFVKVEVGGTLTSPSVKYYFNSGRGWITFDNRELIILQYPNPVNIFYPMSPIQAQAYASDIDTYVEIYERDFFKNSARVDMALSTDIPIDQDKADEIKQRWKEKYQGNFHDVAVLDSGLKPVPIKFTNRDFEFLNLANWSMEKVLAAYRVPKSKLGFADMNRSGSVQADISFNRESIEPRLVTWDEELTSVVCASFDERLQVKHDNPIPRDRLLELQESKVYLAGVPTQTINEWRQEVQNKPPVEGGDVIIIPNKYIKLTDLDKVTAAAIAPKPTAGGDGESDNTGGDGRPDASGSDDRDDNPTDGRSAADITEKDETVIRNVWVDRLAEFIKTSPPKELTIDKLHIYLQSCMIDSITVLYEVFKSKNTPLDNLWVRAFALEIAKRYHETIFSKWNQSGDWSDHVKREFDNNPRMIKITNSIIRSCINYTKYEIIMGRDQKAVWVVNRNECGHKGRVVDGVKCFQLGKHLIRFPGESLNLSCDCTITATDTK
jgi:HK97 family phage portal protein